MSLRIWKWRWWQKILMCYRLQIWQVDEALRDWFEVHVHVVDLVEPQGGADLPLLRVVLHLLLLLLLLLPGVRGSKCKLG